MKIDRPGGPRPPVEGATGAGEAAGVGEAGEAFAERLREAGGAEGAPAADGAAEVDPVKQIAADLDAGRIDPQQAIERLIDAAADRATPAGAPESLRRQIREQLAEAVANDPQLASRARRIGAKLDQEE
jgi:hypothetical protein